MTPLPELKKGDRVTTGTVTWTVRRIKCGRDFFEPVYLFTGAYGVRIREAYTGEELAALGFRYLEKGKDHGSRAGVRSAQTAAS